MIPQNLREVSVTNTVTVTFTTEAELLFVHAIYVASGTVGTRQIKLTVYDDLGQFLFDMHPRVTQIANETVHYEFIPGVPNETAKSSDHITTKLCGCE